MTGALSAMRLKVRVGREMAEFDQLPVEERLAKGRAAYEQACWSKRTDPILVGILLFFAFMFGALVAFSRNLPPY
jgi:hypothetical protein